MTLINGEIKMQGNDDAWFTTNATTVYPANIQIFHEDGRYKFTDGTTQLQNLPWRGASTSLSWGDITGTLSNQTDLQSSLNSKENAITSGSTSQYFRGDKTWQNLDKIAVGLGNVDNTSDTNKPVSTAQAAAIALKEDSANKSTSTADSASTTKFPVWAAIVSFFDTAKIKSLLGITTLSGSNTGDETTATIKTKLGAASTSTDGYLTSTDWNTFNNKLNAPTWIDYSSSSVLTGWSSTTAKIVKYCDMGSYYLYKIVVFGVSSSATTKVSIHVNEAFASTELPIRVLAGATYQSGLAKTTLGSNEIDFYATVAGASFSASGNKSVNVTIEIQK